MLKKAVMKYKGLLLAGVISLALILGLGGMTNADMTWKCGEYYTDFLGGHITTSAPPWYGVARNSGTIANVAGETGHAGIVRFQSASATAGSGYYFALSNSYWGQILLSGNERTEFVFRAQNSSTNFTARMGFLDVVTEGLPVDAVYFNISGTVLCGKTVTNSVVNTTATNYSVSTNTWYRGIITVTAGAAQANFYLYDMSYALLWSSTLGNVPNTVGRETSHGATAYMLVAMAPAANLLDVDFMYMYVPCVATPSPSPSPSSSPSPSPSPINTATPPPTPTPSPPPDACCYKYFLNDSFSDPVCGYELNSLIGFNWTQEHEVMFYGVEVKLTMIELSGFHAEDLNAYLLSLNPTNCSIVSGIEGIALANTSFVNNSVGTYFLDFTDVCLSPGEYGIALLSLGTDCSKAWYEVEEGLNSNSDIGYLSSDDGGATLGCNPDYSIWFKIWEYCWEGCYISPTATPSITPTPITTGTPDPSCNGSTPCPGCPFNLSITSLSGDEAYLSWESTPYVSNFSVRMRADYYPVNESDGQLVYFGINNSYTDTGLSLDISTYYYRVWVEDSGVYSTCYDEASIGGEAMSHVFLFLGIIGFGFGMTWLSSRRPEILLRMVAAFIWLGLLFWTLMGGEAFLDIADIWVYLLSFVFLILCFVPFIWQMRTEVIQSKGRYSWKTYEEPPLFAKSKRVENAKRINRITKMRRRKRRWA